MKIDTNRSAKEDLIFIAYFSSKYWKLIVLSIFIGVIVGFFGAITAGSKFRAVMSVQIGRVGAVDIVIPDKEEHHGSIDVIQGTEFYGLEPGYRLLMTSEELYRKITILYDHRRARRNLIDPPYVSELNNYEGSILEVVVISKTKNQAKELLQSMGNAIIEEHDEIYKSTVQPLLDVKAKVETRYEKILKKYESSDPILDPKLLESENNSIISISKLLYKIDRALSPPNTYPTYIIGPIKIEKAKSFKNVIYPLTGGILALILSVFLSSLIELFRRP